MSVAQDDRLFETTRTFESSRFITRCKKKKTNCPKALIVGNRKCEEINCSGGDVDSLDPKIPSPLVLLSNKVILSISNHLMSSPCGSYLLELFCCNQWPRLTPMDQLLDRASCPALQKYQNAHVEPASIEHMLLKFSSARRMSCFAKEILTCSISQTDSSVRKKVSRSNLDISKLFIDAVYFLSNISLCTILASPLRSLLHFAFSVKVPLLRFKWAANI